MSASTLSAWSLPTAASAAASDFSFRTFRSDADSFDSSAPPSAPPPSSAGSNTAGTVALRSGRSS